MTSPFEIAGSDSWASPALAHRLAEAIDRKVKENTPGGTNDVPEVALRYGKVTAITEPTVSVQVGADPTATTGIPKLMSYAPTVNDIVALLVTGKNQYLCLGKSGSPHTHALPSGKEYITAHPNQAVGVLPRTYPEGMSIMFPGDTGWPTNFPAVLTIRRGNDVAQFVLGIISKSIWYRYSNSGGDVWTAFSQINPELGFNASGQVNSSSYIHAFLGLGDETRIGEIYGAAGVHCPNDEMWFNTEQSRAFRWKMGNVQKGVLDSGGNLSVSGNAYGSAGIAYMHRGQRLTTNALDNNVTYLDGVSLNAYFSTGHYNLVNTTDNPWGDGRWVWLEVFSHISGGHWQKQIIHDMTGGSTQYFRKCSGGDPLSAGAWTGWSYMHG